MPIQATYDKALFSSAATAESLSVIAAQATLADVDPTLLLGLVAYGSDAANRGKDLVAWRAAFPAVLGALDDATASFLIRVAVAIGGGVVI